MRRVLHMTLGAMVLGAACSAPAAAFQRMPIAPAPSLTGPQSTGQGLTFDVEQPGKDAGRTKKSGGRELPGVGALGGLPKMNFGLELLYGSPEPQGPTTPSFQDPTAPSFSDWSADDLKVLGKIRRRF